MHIYLSAQLFIYLDLSNNNSLGSVTDKYYTRLPTWAPFVNRFHALFFRVDAHWRGDYMLMMTRVLNRWCAAAQFTHDVGQWAERAIGRLYSQKENVKPSPRICIYCSYVYYECVYSFVVHPSFECIRIFVFHVCMRCTEQMKHIIMYCICICASCMCSIHTLHMQH